MFLSFLACQSSQNDSSPAKTEAKTKTAKKKVNRLKNDTKPIDDHAGHDHAKAPDKKGPFNKFYGDDDISWYVQAPNTPGSEMRLRTTGMGNDFNQAYKATGYVIGGQLLDLDKDGFNELYMTIESWEKPYYKEIICLASINNEKVVQIEVFDTDLKRLAPTDRVFEQQKGLYRAFKTKEGKNHFFKYALSKSGEKYTLQAAPFGN